MQCNFWVQIFTQLQILVKKVFYIKTSQDNTRVWLREVPWEPYLPLGTLILAVRGRSGSPDIYLQPINLYRPFTISLSTESFFCQKQVNNDDVPTWPVSVHCMSLQGVFPSASNFESSIHIGFLIGGIYVTKKYMLQLLWIFS